MYDQDSDVSHREAILDEARDIITKSRNNTYGPPHQDFKRTAALWTIVFNHKFEPHDVATALELLKISRRTWSPGHKDSWLDSIGYGACGWEAYQLEQEKNEG